MGVRPLATRRGAPLVGIDGNASGFGRRRDDMGFVRHRTGGADARRGAGAPSLLGDATGERRRGADAMRWISCDMESEARTRATRRGAPLVGIDGNASGLGHLRDDIGFFCDIGPEAPTGAGGLLSSSDKS